MSRRFELGEQSPFQLRKLAAQVNADYIQWVQVLDCQHNGVMGLTSEVSDMAGCSEEGKAQ